MKGVEYIMLEDKAYQIKACCGSDDLGQKEKGGSRLISVPSDPVSQIRVDGGQVQPVIKRQQNVGDDEIAYEEAETGLHIGCLLYTSGAYPQGARGCGDACCR